jgi:hypothetical protein
MNKWILTILALTIAACGGEEGEPEQTPSPVAIPGGTTSSGNTGGTTGGNTGGGSSSDDFCGSAMSVFWCDDASSSGGSTASLGRPAHRLRCRGRR